MKTDRNYQKVKKVLACICMLLKIIHMPKGDSYLITTGCNIELQWEEHENISNDS